MEVDALEAHHVQAPLGQQADGPTRDAAAAGRGRDDVPDLALACFRVVADERDEPEKRAIVLRLDGEPGLRGVLPTRHVAADPLGPLRHSAEPERT